MTAKSVLVRPQSLRPRARASSCYATVYGAHLRDIAPKQHSYCTCINLDVAVANRLQHSARFGRLRIRTIDLPHTRNARC